MSSLVWHRLRWGPPTQKNISIYLSPTLRHFLPADGWLPFSCLRSPFHLLPNLFPIQHTSRSEARAGRRSGLKTKEAEQARLSGTVRRSGMASQRGKAERMHCNATSWRVERAPGSGSAGRIWCASDSSARRAHRGRRRPIRPFTGCRCKHVRIGFPATR